MFNKTIIIGNLSQDINLKYTPNGSAIAKSTIASNYKYKSNNGELLAPETFVQLAGVNPYSQPKSIRTLSRRSFVQNGL